MTENNQNTTETPADDAVSPDSTPDAPEVQETHPEAAEDKTANREAAKYRRQLRETEAARDTAQQMLTTARAQILRTEFQGHLGGLTTDALEAGGHPVDSFFTEDGTLDVQRLRTAATEVMERFGLTQKLIIPSEGRSPENTYMGNGWQDAFTAK